MCVCVCVLIMCTCKHLHLLTDAIPTPPSPQGHSQGQCGLFETIANKGENVLQGQASEWMLGLEGCAESAVATYT